MTSRLFLATAALILSASGTLSGSADAQSGRSSAIRQPADLATEVAGSYRGDVISDARGSSRSDVTVTVVRIGPNRVRISSDYARLPAFEAALGRYMQTIQNVGGDQVFLFESAKSPPALSITVDDASWAGTRG